MSHPYADDAGPWLLGALAQDEARAFSSHLESCELCRGEVARLQFVVDNLPLAAPLEAPPAALRARIMATVEAEAQLLQAAGTGADRPPRTAASTAPAGPLRRWFGAVRPLPAAALACALLLAGLGAGSVLSGDGSDVPRTRTVRARAEVPDATARLEVTGQTARLAVSRMPAPPKGRVYQVWLKRDGRTAEPTHTLFTVRRDGRTTVAIDEPLGDADELLVTAEPDGGSIIPTRQPVLRASL